MTAWPQAGDACVDLRSAARSWDRDAIGGETTVKTVTQTLVITATGAKYHRSTLTPVNEGPHSARHLVRPTDDRVLCVRGRLMLADIASRVENLANLHHKDPAEYISAFAQVIAEGAEARKDFLALTRAASKERDER